MGDPKSGNFTEIKLIGVFSYGIFKEKPNRTRKKTDKTGNLGEKQFDNIVP